MERYGYARRVEDVDWTQLQFIVDACPGGVRSRYRAYAHDEVIELWSKESILATEGAEVPTQIMAATTQYVPVNVQVFL